MLQSLEGQGGSTYGGRYRALDQCEARGEERATSGLTGSLSCLALHPWQPFAACGDECGGVHLIEFVGLEFGPIVVTAAEGEDGLSVKCPACRQEPGLEAERLGSVLAGPTPDCGLELRVSPFAPGPVAPKSTRWRQVGQADVSG